MHSLLSVWLFASSAIAFPVDPAFPANPASPANPALPNQPPSLPPGVGSSAPNTLPKIPSEFQNCRSTCEPLLDLYNDNAKRMKPAENILAVICPVEGNSDIKQQYSDCRVCATKESPEFNSYVKPLFSQCDTYFLKKAFGLGK